MSAISNAELENRARQMASTYKAGSGRAAMLRLDPREDKERNWLMFEERYGLSASGDVIAEPRRLREIGNKYEISRERARQIIAKCIVLLSHGRSE